MPRLPLAWTANRPPGPDPTGDRVPTSVPEGITGTFRTVRVGVTALLELDCALRG